MSEMRIAVDDRELTANWTDDAPETRAAIAAALPLSGRATRWGEELYFDCGVDAPPENASADVPVGGVAYWPGGNALCLFWGPTPESDDRRPRAAAPVNLVAIIDDVGPLSGLDGAATVRIDRP